MLTFGWQHCQCIEAAKLKHALKNVWTEHFCQYPLSTCLIFQRKYIRIFFLQREVRKLLAEGKIPTYEKGEIVVKLMEHEKATEEEALIAATNCDNVETAKTYLRQECELCMNDMKIVEVKLYVCTTYIYPSLNLMNVRVRH